MSKLKVPKPGYLRAGQNSAARGSVAIRPWHAEDHRYALTRISDAIVAEPLVRNLLGPDVQVNVRTSASGRGLVFEVEPL